ncbi:hypothetical protein T07_14106, partial [Trichinella nelsoni]
LKNKDNKHVNGKKNAKMSCNNTKSGSSERTVILSVMYHSNVSGRSSSDLRALLIATKRDSVEQLENFVVCNHVRRERKETIEQLKILYLPITFGVSEKRLCGVSLCCVKLTPSYNDTRYIDVTSRNSKQQIHRKHFLLKNKDNKHVNGGSSERTVILSVMYHSNVSGRSSSDLRALLIATKRDSVEQLENFVVCNHVRRERKETIEQLKILYLPITFGVSEKRLCG